MMNVMKIVAALAVLMFLSVGLSLAECPVRLNLYEKVPESVAMKSKEGTMIHPAQIDSSLDCIEGGIKYTFAWEGERNARFVSYIHTIDKNFKTKDGFKIGDEIDLSVKDIYRFPYFVDYGPFTVDGWRMQIGILSPDLEVDPGDLMKRKKIPSEGKMRIRIIGFSKNKYFAQTKPQNK